MKSAGALQAELVIYEFRVQSSEFRVKPEARNPKLEIETGLKKATKEFEAFS